MEERDKIPDVIATEEYLYRGVVDSLWSSEHNRPASGIFDDSKGVSVDRDVLVRGKEECINALLLIKQFKAICRIKQKAVAEVDAITKYLPTPQNIYHSEIHDSENKITLTMSKRKKLRDAIEIVYFREQQ